MDTDSESDHTDSHVDSGDSTDSDTDNEDEQYKTVNSETIRDDSTDSEIDDDDENEDERSDYKTGRSEDASQDDSDESMDQGEDSPTDSDEDGEEESPTKSQSSGDDVDMQSQSEKGSSDDDDDNDDDDISNSNSENNNSSDDEDNEDVQEENDEISEDKNMSEDENENEENEGDDKKERIDPRLETLNRLQKYLESYTPEGELDEENILARIDKMNKLAAMRKALRKVIDREIRNVNEFDEEADFDDSDLYMRDENHLHAAVNVVETGFFYDIIEAVEDQSDDFILDDDTIKILKVHICITDDGKKRKRKDLRVRRKFSRAHSESFDSGDESTGGNGRRLTPRLAKNRRKKSIVEDEDEARLETLLIEVANEELNAGRSMKLIQRSQSRKLRNTKIRRARKEVTFSPPLDLDLDAEYLKLHDESGREVTKIIIDGEAFTPPKKRGPKRKRFLLDNLQPVPKKKRGRPKKLPLSLKFQRQGPSINRYNNVVNVAGKKPMLPTQTKSFQTNEVLFTRDNIDFVVRAWENVASSNKKHDMKILDPSMKEVYAHRCKKLLTVLRSSGRIFARHEFFYGDIDKAWYDVNPFHQDLVANGIDLDLKLTRNEWKAIRRRVRSKPIRRFSRKFINEQRRELKIYRKRVWRIQLDYNEGRDIRDKGFEYKVFAPIKPGAIVAAYHHKAHLIQRGTVLHHNVKNHSYLVQFERPALGYEWCPEYEVASHGLPEIIFPLHSKPLHLSFYEGKDAKYGNPHNCSNYGPLLELKQNEHVESEESDEEKLILAKIEERVALVTLMVNIDILLERKALILSTLDDLSKNLENVLKESAEDPMTCDKTSEKYSEFKDHEKFLLNNLKTTEKTLQAAMASLRIIYGKSYFSKQDKKLEDATKPKIETIEEVSEKFGDEISKAINSPEGSSLDTMTMYQSCQLSSAANFLLLTDISKESSNEAAVLKSKLWNQLEHLQPEKIISLPSDAQTLLNKREDAYKNFRTAFAELNNLEILADDVKKNTLRDGGGNDDTSTNKLNDEEGKGNNGKQLIS